MRKLLFNSLFLFIVFASAAQENFLNPILAGWYPDPAITDDGEGNFYMVHSTFAFYPGIPVFHSTDLVNWEQVGNAIHRPGQVDLHGFGTSRAVFAPDISYDNGTYYLTCTIVDGKGNFVMTAKDPAGPWSDPVWLPEVSGIDPGLFFDDNGKSYLVYNSEPPNNEAKYEGHRTIRMIEFDKENLKTIGDNRILVDGGVDISTKPVWAEGPRIYKLNGYYYLMTAEGGTAVNHSEMIYRNTNIEDEFIPFKENPILTQRHLDPDRDNPITSAGHADIVQHPNGDWYGVFLAVRPYEGDLYNTGRETFLTPVKWENDWPIFDLGGEEIQYSYPLPDGVEINKELFPMNGNFSFEEKFDKDELPLNWMMLRNPKTSWYDLKDDAEGVSLKTRSETVEGKANPSFLAHRQQHIIGEASISVKFDAEAENEKAGLLAFQNESHYYFAALSKVNEKPVVQFYKSDELIETVSLENSVSEVEFKLKFEEDEYTFFYKTGENWQRLGETQDGKFLSTQVAGGFVGVNLGLYTTSNGKESDNEAIFNWFRYSGNDEVYRK
ncbi:glycoside hydrolase family 43 protein [Salegentibacter salegens]|uniref:Alpha-N-arabinofuranosidase n=1 Tax=Salegentibacter salegens TaxID=143223 RepID=A0A1M7N6A3_9FLAO|nr:glycoside hydrolase family 43 protein [Salegentibacter salegens]PRX46879.1 alpha-N-arabinofuranosidase [Salegentibacter salegens]SHM99020.1 alpha-N-arabinofuranosidase [Salegentibacter salegens]